ncbi:MAG: nucleotidyltransferase family protein [Clostridiales bacterium]|jgi:glucose-1-phosphate thymidylyltransferase|nr:nucleotidyltransferase family protein [Clostridiales bacterium]
MKAIILVAGYATRLYPLTENKPKALLGLDGKPILNYIIEQVNLINEINEIIVVSNDKFYKHFEEWKFENKIPITVLNDGTTTEDGRLGAIGDIYFAIQKLNIKEDIMVIAGDNYFTYQLSDYFKYYKRINKDCICVKPIEDYEDRKRYAIVIVDGDSKVIDLEEKPPYPKSDLAAFATYIYKQETLPLFQEYLDSGNNKDAPGFFVQWLYKEKDVHAYKMSGECYDIGTPESYREVNEIVKNINSGNI